MRMVVVVSWGGWWRGRGQMHGWEDVEKIGGGVIIASARCQAGGRGGGWSWQVSSRGWSRSRGGRCGGRCRQGGIQQRTALFWLWFLICWLASLLVRFRLICRLNSGALPLLISWWCIGNCFSIAAVILCALCSSSTAPSRGRSPFCRSRSSSRSSAATRLMLLRRRTSRLIGWRSWHFWLVLWSSTLHTRFGFLMTCSFLSETDHSMILLPSSSQT